MQIVCVRQFGAHFKHVALPDRIPAGDLLIFPGTTTGLVLIFPLLYVDQHFAAAQGPRNPLPRLLVGPGSCAEPQVRVSDV